MGGGVLFHESCTHYHGGHASHFVTPRKSHRLNPPNGFNLLIKDRLDRRFAATTNNNPRAFTTTLRSEICARLTSSPGTGKSIFTRFSGAMHAASVSMAMSDPDRPSTACWKKKQWGSIARAPVPSTNFRYSPEAEC